MSDTLSIIDNRTGKRYEVPIKDGTIRAMDLRQIKAGDDDFGLMTYDPAFTYIAVAYLLLFGELPTTAQLASWQQSITTHTMLHENIKHLMRGFRYDAHPMGVFLATVGALSTFYPDAKRVGDAEARLLQCERLIAKTPTVAAYAYRHSTGRFYVYPDNELSFAGNFLNMLFKIGRA